MEGGGSAQREEAGLRISYTVKFCCTEEDRRPPDTSVRCLSHAIQPSPDPSSTTTPTVDLSRHSPPALCSRATHVVSAEQRAWHSASVVLVMGMRQRGGVLSVHVVTCVCCVVLVTLAR